MPCCKLVINKNVSHKKGIRNVSENMVEKIQAKFNIKVKINSKICASCRMTLDLDKDEDSNNESDIDENYEYQRASNKIEILNQFISSVDISPVRDLKKQTITAKKEKFNEISKKVTDIIKIDYNITADDAQNSLLYIEMIQQLKERFSETSLSSEKIQILTVLPKSWTITQIMMEFGVSRHMAEKVKQVFIQKPL